MLTIPLQATPNQRYQFTADNLQYAIRVWWDGDDTMYMDVTVNNVVIATSLQCRNKQQVLPYDYLEGSGGNFFFTTASGDNPTWQNFNGNDVLLYASNSELATARAQLAAQANTIVLGKNQAM